MNRLLLKECLDELRSDDLEELTEAHNHRSKHKKHPGRKRRQTQKKLGAGPNYAHRHSGSSKPTSRNQSNRKPTTGIDSKTGQELASLAETIAQEGAKSPEDFLNELSTRCGRPMAVADNSKYFTNTNTGVNLRLRLANHRGSAEWFFVNGHPRNNFGIVIKMEPKRFVPDKRVQYREEIFFKDDLDAEMEIGIVKGLMNWVATGRYNGPLGNETATSPDGRVVLNRRPRNRLAPNPQQPTTPPLSPPTGPGVLESLATKYFKEAHNMKYRLLIEAALKELTKEDFEDRSHRYSISPDADEVDAIEGPVIGKVKRPMYVRTMRQKKGQRVRMEVINAAREIFGVREAEPGGGSYGGYIYGGEASFPIRKFECGWSNDSYYDLYSKKKLPHRGFYVSLDGDLVDASVISKEDETAFTRVLTEIMEDAFQTEEVSVSFKKGEYPEGRDHDCIWREWLVDFGDDGLRERW